MRCANPHEREPNRGSLIGQQQYFNRLKCLPRPFARYGKLTPTVNELSRNTRCARISLSIFVTFHHNVSVAYKIPFGR
jgi:hypothetical protein